MERSLTGPKPKLVMPRGATDTQMHVYLDGFAAQPAGPGLPPGRAGIAEYQQVMDWLGLERVVVTQGNAHQFDNANLLSALAAFGNIARGVAVVTGGTSDAELETLHAAGVRGARVMDLPGGAVGLSRLAEVDARVHNLGWVLAVQFDGTRFLAHLPKLEAIESRFIIDHHGKFFDGIASGDPRLDAVKRLIEKGNCWFKLAGCYESSKTGGPDFADVGIVAREIVRHAPERVIWGSNWPHNASLTPEAYPDDAALLDLLLDWAPERAWQEKILVDNPAQLFGF
jgi:D-galactarolactone isomerase